MDILLQAKKSNACEGVDVHLGWHTGGRALHLAGRCTGGRTARCWGSVGVLVLAGGRWLAGAGSAVK